MFKCFLKVPRGELVATILMMRNINDLLMEFWLPPKLIREIRYQLQTNDLGNDKKRRATMDRIYQYIEAKPPDDQGGGLEELPRLSVEAVD